MCNTCRNYEESTITGVYNKSAIPEALRKHLSQSMQDLVHAICSFFVPDAGFMNVMDRSTTLKYHDKAECLSLHSSKMDASILKKWGRGKYSAGAGMDDLQPFDVDISNSKMRGKCFTTSRIKDSQVQFSQPFAQAFPGALCMCGRSVISMFKLYAVMCARLSSIGCTVYQILNTSMYKVFERPTNRCSEELVEVNVQSAYIAAHEQAMQAFGQELEALREQITSPDTSISLVLTILLAQEFTAWGRLVTAVAEVAYNKRWSLPTLSGIVVFAYVPSVHRQGSNMPPGIAVARELEAPCLLHNHPYGCSASPSFALLDQKTKVAKRMTLKHLRDACRWRYCT